MKEFFEEGTVDGPDPHLTCFCVSNGDRTHLVITGVVDGSINRVDDPQLALQQFR